MFSSGAETLRFVTKVRPIAGFFRFEITSGLGASFQMMECPEHGTDSCCPYNIVSACIEGWSHTLLIHMSAGLPLCLRKNL